MAEFKEIPKARLVMALMYSNKDVYEEATELLTKKFGEIEFKSDEFDFNFTTYYEKEFGKPLKKVFIVFKKPIKRKGLVDIRLYTQDLEKKLKQNNKRRINIDPGYITKDSLVMASLKEQPYKIYLGKGVFGHMIIMFKKMDIIPFRHSFPDYLANKDFFLQIRKNL